MIKKLIILIITLLLISCGSPNLRLYGTMHYIDRLGYRCWYIDAGLNKYYEIISEDPLLLRDGLKVYLYARPVKKQTICDFPLVLEVISYHFDPDQRNVPTTKPTPIY